MENKNFIKKIRRIEVKRAIEDLRQLIRTDMLLAETARDIDKYTSCNQTVARELRIVAVRLNIKKMFKTRNDFSLLEI